jgi:hypothetical protein
LKSVYNASQIYSYFKALNVFKLAQQDITLMKYLDGVSDAIAIVRLVQPDLLAHLVMETQSSQN